VVKVCGDLSQDVGWVRAAIRIQVTLTLKNALYELMYLNL